MVEELLILPMIGFFIIILIVAAILAFVLWVLMLIDAAKRKFKSDNEKVVWIIILALTGVLGAIIYYFVVKRQNSKGIAK